MSATLTVASAIHLAAVVPAMFAGRPSADVSVATGAFQFA